MYIRQLTSLNHYGVVRANNLDSRVAEFVINHNRTTDETEVIWLYGQDNVPMQLLSDIYRIEYNDGEV